MSRHDERERIRQRLGALTIRVSASRVGVGERESGVAARSPGERRDRSRSLESDAGRSTSTRQSAYSARPGKVCGSRRTVPSAGLWDLAELPPEPSAHSATVGGRSAAGGADADGDAEFGDVPSPSWLDDPRGTSWRARLVPERFRGTRFDPGRRGVVTLAALGCVAVVVATALALRERPVAHPVPPLPAVRTTATAASARPPGAVPPLSVAAAAGAAPSTNPGGAPSETELVVSVVGLVHRGGLVRLPAGARVADAIAAAGGAKEGADLNGINLAKRLLDGDQVLVGSSGPTTGQLGSTTISADGRPADANAGTPHRTGRVNLSTATEADLEELPGVGPVTAHAIIAWRTANGRFTSVEQLAEVDGIGPARLAKLRELVTV